MLLFYEKLKGVMRKEEYEEFYEYFESAQLSIVDNKKSIIEENM